jgi:hypothetical protein
MLEAEKQLDELREKKLRGDMSIGEYVRLAFKVLEQSSSKEVCLPSSTTQTKGKPVHAS